MRLLEKVVATRTAKLANIEHEARNLLSHLDTLGGRLRRAFDVASIDIFVRYLNMERKRMLEEEKRAESNQGPAGLVALGGLGLISLFSGRKPNWGQAISAAFPEEPFGDVMVAVSEDNIELVNVSKMARERNTTVTSVLAYLKQKGNEVLGWPEFEARARGLRIAAFRGELTFLAKEPAKLYLKSHDSPHFVGSV